MIKIIPAGGGAGQTNITVDNVAPDAQGNIALGALTQINATTPTTLSGDLTASNGLIGVNTTPKLTMTKKTMVLYAADWTEDADTGLPVQAMQVPQMTATSTLSARFGGSDFASLLAYREAALVIDVENAPLLVVYVDVDANGVQPTVDVPIELTIYDNAVDVSWPAKGTPLEQWTWAQLSDLGKSGEDVSTWFAIGDTKIMGGYPVAIADFYHDTDITSGTQVLAPFTFTLTSHINLLIPMNPASQVNQNGWQLSNARTVLRTAYWDAYIPMDLKPYIREVRKPTNSGNGTSVTTPETLFMFSSREFYGTEAGGSMAGEGEYYPYWTVANKAYALSNNAYRLWTRSCISNTNNYIALNYINATSVTAVATSQTTNAWPCFGFCV